jgi:O-antigen ligase
LSTPRPAAAVIGSQGFRSAGSAVLIAAGVAVVASAAAVLLGPLALMIPVAAIAAVVLVRDPPVLLALFVYVPYFEGAPGIRAVPFDPTVGVAALLLLALARRLLSGERWRFPPAAFTLGLAVLGVLVLIGLLWTAAPDYGREKALKFFTVTALAALSPFALLTTQADVRRFLYAIVAGGLLVAVLTPVLPPTVVEGIATQYDTQGRYSFGGQIFPARFLCTAALIMLLLPGLARTRSRWRWAAPVVALGVAYVALGFGARGPIGAFAVTLAAVALLLSLRSARALVGVLCAVAVSAAVLPFVTVPDSASQRLREATSNPVATLRGDTRWVLYEQGLDLIAEHPIVGAGTGSYASFVGVVSPPRQRLLYPHNIFLELWAELGILAVAAFLLIVLSAVWALMRRLVEADDPSERQLLVLALGLLIYNLLVSQVSGDINHNRSVLVAAAIGLLLARGLPADRRASPPA